VEPISRPQLAVYAAAAIAIALLGARYLRDGAHASAAAPRASHPATLHVARAGGGLVTVDVAGAVRRPGVYRLGPGARVDDALRRAGGAARRADLTAVNRAAKLQDGRQVIVPRRGEAATAALGSPGAAAAVGGATGGAPAARVNLNTATPEQLDTLDGVGPVMAQKIIRYRQEHGGFGSISELDQVPGIGAKRMAALRELVVV
jgi:competence protein ComEA